MRAGTGARIGIVLLAAGAAALVIATAISYSLTTLAMVVCSLALAAGSFWSCTALFGSRAAWIFLGLGAALGWFAEQMGSTRGWFFGSYTNTDVLGPRLAEVPLVIPCMWFGLCHIGLVLASLALWRQPAPQLTGWKSIALAALMSAMIVTAFDLGADPYFVYQLKAWIMQEKDGDWFGETVRGFEGWMIVSFAIISAFLAIAKPRLEATPDRQGRWAALLPILMYAFMMLFQLAVAQPIALRFIAFFAMGIPTVIALVAWAHWSREPQGAPA